MQSNITWFICNIAISKAQHKSEFNLKIEIPYLDLKSQLWVAIVKIREKIECIIYALQSSI